MTEKLLIGVDLDGTILEPRYPELGLPLPNAARVLKRLVKHGHQLMLWTCRTGADLEEARRIVEEDMGVPLHSVNRNRAGDRYQSSPKAWADVYVDDSALGAPLTRYRRRGGRVDYWRARDMIRGHSYFTGIDWQHVEAAMIDRGALPRWSKERRHRWT